MRWLWWRVVLLPGCFVTGARRDDSLGVLLIIGIAQRLYKRDLMMIVLSVTVTSEMMILGVNKCIDD